jgi:hypothetical protein
VDYQSLLAFSDCDVATDTTIPRCSVYRMAVSIALRHLTHVIRGILYAGLGEGFCVSVFTKMGQGFSNEGFRSMSSILVGLKRICHYWAIDRILRLVSL